MKILKSFVYAGQGLKYLFKNEVNGRIHLILTIIVLIAGIYFHINTVEWMIITLCIALVFASELFNTAIEKTIDLVSPEKNELAGSIKDLAAAAVLVITMTSFVIGIIIFYPYIF